jgi:hypothetical protein
MNKYKTVKSRTEYYIELTDEERELAGWTENQKFDWKLQDDGSVALIPWKAVDIGDIGDLPRRVLEMLVQESLDKDVPVNLIISDILKQSLEQYKSDDTIPGSIDPSSINNDIGLPGGQRS